MFGNFFKKFFNVIEADRKLKKSEKLLQEAKQIQEWAANYCFEVDTKLLEFLEKKDSKIEELEQKVKIYEELILKFNLFEKKP